MSAQLDDDKDLQLTNPGKKDSLRKDGAEPGDKMIHDHEHPEGTDNPPLQLGEWIEGIVD
ncbi:MAG: hypothetical protein V4488_05630 [Pseudomonadota bacterium]